MKKYPSNNKQLLIHNAMKKLLIALLCGTGIIACQPKFDGYVINGNIDGNSNGMKVFLQKAYANPPVMLDSSVIQNGKFQLKGKIDQPGMYKLIIDKSGLGNGVDMLASNFYLENSEISYSGHVDSLRTYYWSDETFRKDPMIKGSATQDLYIQYKQATAELSKKYSETHEKYLEVYHRPAIDGIFNTEEGITLAREMDKLGKELEVARWNFIEQHPNTVVAYDLASQFLEGMYVNLTAPQIDQLTDIITKAWANNPQMAEAFKTKAEKAKPMALGSKYQDIELMNPDGKMVKLSEYVPEGKYVMLEFWASWCGPCRGEIPHLRHVYKDYKDKGFEIISISIDEKKADWDKAMKEEGMVWKQLCDPKGFEGPVAQIYNITGVPTCIVLDKEGRIFKTEMRGASLDAVLEELYD